MDTDSALPAALSPLDAAALPKAAEIAPADGMLPLPAVAEPLTMAKPPATQTQALSLATAAPPLTGMAPAGGSWTMAGSLLLVVGLILLLGRGVRLLQGRRAGSAPTMQLRGSLQVGSRERVVWMQAGDTHLLLGVSAGRVNNLHVFDVPPDLDQVEQPASPALGGADFALRLRQALDRARRRAAAAVAPSAAPPAPVVAAVVTAAATPAPASAPPPAVAAAPRSRLRVAA